MTDDDLREVTLVYVNDDGEVIRYRKLLSDEGLATVLNLMDSEGED